MTVDDVMTCDVCRVFTTTCPSPGPEEAPLVPPNTDGQEISLPGLNDYSGQVLKDERSELETGGSLATLRVCTNSQGGLLDNPGLVTAGCGNVLDKWDQVCGNVLWQCGNVMRQCPGQMGSGTALTSCLLVESSTRK